jgi:CheY-like chemotaxis protein
VNVETERVKGGMHSSKRIVLLVDTNFERRTLRKKVLKLQGVEVIVCSDLAEATSIWQRERYHLVLIDIRADHFGSMAFRDEIRKDSPTQLVAFLVGRPNYIAFAPSIRSYIPDAQCALWGEAVRRSMHTSCELLPQRNGFLEASWMIKASKRLRGSMESAADHPLPVPETSNNPSSTGPAMELLFN